MAVRSSLILHSNDFLYFRGVPLWTSLVLQRFINSHQNQSTVGWAAMGANFDTAGFAIMCVYSFLILIANEFQYIRAAPPQTLFILPVCVTLDVL